MTLADFIAALARRWFLVVTSIVLAIGAALAYSLLADPVYRAQTSTFVSLRQDISDSNILQGSQFTLQRVKSYPQVVTSPAVLQPVIDQLDLGTSVERLRDRITVVNPHDTVLLNISVTADSPQQAADIANAVTTQFVLVVDGLEKANETAQSPVRITITQPATPPQAPISPRLSLNLLLGAIAGVGIGVGLAVLRQLLDNSVTSSRNLSYLTDAANLGAIITHSNKPAASLEDSALESYRTLRTNLAYIDRERTARQIVVTSPGSGEGRSTTVSNLAHAMNRAGMRVITLDSDLRSPSLTASLKVDSGLGLTDVLRGKATIEQVTHKWAGGQVVGAGTSVPNPSELLSSTAMADLLNRLADDYDLVLMDSPPILQFSDAAVLAGHAHGAILIARSGHTTRHEVADAADALTAAGARVIGCLLTFAAPITHRGRRAQHGRRRPVPA